MNLTTRFVNWWWRRHADPKECWITMHDNYGDQIGPPFPIVAHPTTPGNWETDVIPGLPVILDPRIVRVRMVDSEGNQAEVQVREG